jgi:tRNA nucleotidyltransferase (CCA-adding enzyme)
MLELIAALPVAKPLLSRLDSDVTVYLVGGAVRDLLLGQRPLDLDLVVERDPVQLAECLGGRIRAHGRFGTATVTLDGAAYDIARARRERYVHPGALPDVEPAPLAEDLKRRDFTVNALAVALNGRCAGEVVGAPGALDDLERRELRVLHERSFEDDPTRLLRLARYAARLGFDPSPETARLAREALAAGALSTVSGERIGAELRLLAREPDPVGGLSWLTRLGLDRALHPGFGLEDPALLRAALELLPGDGRTDRLALAAASLGLERPDVEVLLDRLAFTAPDRDAILAAAAGAEPLADALRTSAGPAQIAAAVGGLPVEAVALAGALGPGEQARSWLERLRHVRLEIGGHDLLAAGVPAGPEIGRGLRAALAAKLDGRATDRGAELDVALAAARSGQ